MKNQHRQHSIHFVAGYQVFVRRCKSVSHDLLTCMLTCLLDSIPGNQDRLSVRARIHLVRNFHSDAGRLFDGAGELIPYKLLPFYCMQAITATRRKQVKAFEKPSLTVSSREKNCVSLPSPTHISTTIHFLVSHHLQGIHRCDMLTFI